MAEAPFGDLADCLCVELRFIGKKLNLALCGFPEFNESDEYPENCPPKYYGKLSRTGQAYIDFDGGTLTRIRGTADALQAWDWTDPLNPVCDTGSSRYDVDSGTAYVEYDDNEVYTSCDDLPDTGGSNWLDLGDDSILTDNEPFLWEENNDNEDAYIMERTSATQLDVKDPGLYNGDTLQICDESPDLQLTLSEEITLADFATEIDDNLSPLLYDDIKDEDEIVLSTGEGFTQSEEFGIDAMIFSPMVEIGVSPAEIEKKGTIKVSWEVVLRENAARDATNCDPGDTPTSLNDDPDPEGTILDCIRYEDILEWNSDNGRFQSQSGNVYLIVGDTHEASYFIEKMRVHRLIIGGHTNLTSPPTCLNTWSP